MTVRHVAVIDIGKTNAKLALVDLSTLAEVEVVTRPNRVLPGPPWPHFDLQSHWQFLLESLRAFHARHGIDAISVTTHGASAVLLGRDGHLAAPMLDYEHAGPDEVARDYDAIRPDFAETGSPRLGVGLNLGAQLFWQFRAMPGLLARTATIVTYPQYWGHRLTSVAATEVSSLGCHTDLWNPHAGRFSSLVERLGIGEKIAPARRSDEILGPILPEVAARTGLSVETPVYCGIHDSNASLLPHILGRAAPFSVVSTGTWVIAMAVGGAAVVLDPARDTLINVNALGQPVPSARFMGGREFEIASRGVATVPTPLDCQEILTGQTMLLPALVTDSGPFRHHTARWVPAEPPVGTGVRTAVVSYYLALMTAQCLELIGHRGDVFVEGPLARNTAFLEMLSAATCSAVVAAGSATGTSQGAALLAAGGHSPPLTDAPAIRRESDPGLLGYARVWRRQVG